MWVGLQADAFVIYPGSKLAIKRTTRLISNTNAFIWVKQMADIPEQNWDNATWTGSRRAMIRQSLKLSVRQRLQALEDLCATSQALANLKRTGHPVHEQAGDNSAPATTPDDK